MFPGFPNWVYKELKDKFMRDIAKGRKFEDCGVDIKIIDPFSRKHSVFIGGSILASVMQQDAWVTKQWYEEEGDRCLGSSTSL